MGRTVEIPVVHMEFGSFIMVAKELTLLGLMGHNGMVLMSERHCAVGGSMVFLLQQLCMYWHSCRPTRIISSQMHLSLPMITADSEHL
jgi:hypothetical protein